MSNVTFRDFASALMSDKLVLAAEHLSSLLGLEPAAATTATQYFAARTEAEPQFMMKAMGLRPIVEGQDHAGACVLLAECFNLAPEQATASATVLLAQY